MSQKTTCHYEFLEDSEKYISVFQGGTRSGKTYNIMLWLICHLRGTPRVRAEVVRKTLPSMHTSVIADFKEIMINNGWFDDRHYSKKFLLYEFQNGSTIQFISCDDPQKKRGSKRDILYINEANELEFDDFFQLSIRTTEKIILDFNPSDQHHWIYDDVITRPDAELHKSSYLDNPFLPEQTIKGIEHYQGDSFLWSVFGLGERSVNHAQIFTEWHTLPHINHIDTGQVYIGMDFGYNDPTVIVLVKIYDKDIYIDEWCYQTHMIETDMIQSLKDLHAKIKISPPIYGDGSRPEIIESIRRAGFNIKQAKKGKNSILDGINLMKSRKIYITSRSINTIKEFKMYKFKEGKDGILDEPIDKFNHGIDAIRYALTPERITDTYKNSTLAYLGIK